MDFSIGIAEISSVFLIEVSNVLMPLSQSMIFSFPPAMMYSALITSSSRVLARPRFKSTGLSDFPNALSSWKFCILRAPTWTISTSWNSSRCSGVIISVTTGSPVAFLASSSSLRPLFCSPWKEYGEVLGLKAPPRSSPAPLFITSVATSVICSLVSIEHGPAMTWKLPPPIFLPATSITVSSGCIFLFAFL